MNPALKQAQVIDFRLRVPVGLYEAPESPEENTEHYEAVLGTKTKIAAADSLEHLLAGMDVNGIDYAVMHAEYETGDLADRLNKTVSEVVNKHPDRFSGIGTISMENFSIPRALKQADDCADYGMIGLSIQPAFFGMEIGDKRLYPIYAKAQEHNLLIALHTGINYTSHRPMSGEHPLQIDRLCCDFPGLKIVASHAAWPWVTEMVAVARKHPRVFLEFGGLSPKYIAAPGGGWEVMHRFMNSVLKEQILYGTDWPVMDHSRTLGEWREMGLRPEVLEGLLGGNAKRLIDRFGSSKQ